MTGTTSVQASGSFTPSTAHGDQQPQLGTAAFVLAQYHMTVTFTNSRIAAASNASFTYTYGNSVLCGATPTLPGCQQLIFTATTFATLVFSGIDNGTATITGMATVIVGGITTTNPFTITTTDASRAGGSNQFQLRIGDPTSPTTMLYKATNAGTAHIT